MSKHRIKRSFPAARVLRIGEVVDTTDWRNKGLLERQGYIEQVADETELTPADAPPESAPGANNKQGAADSRRAPRAK